MNKSHLLLACLVAGLAIGFGAHMIGWAPLDSAIDALAPVGAIWVKALQMTIVPLIFAMVASSVAASVRSGQGGRMIGGVLLSFVPILLVAVLFAGLTAAAICRFWPIPPNALAGLGLAHTVPPPLPGFADQIMALIPKNPVAAAAAGDITPLVIFAIVLGVALTRLPRREGGGLEGALNDLVTAMMTIVEWVLWAAPVGVFVLSMGATHSGGPALASLLAHYVVIGIVSALVLILACYGAVWASGAMGLGRFVRGILPPQAVAAGCCSSLATLPAMIEAAEQNLGIPERVAGSVLPLAVSSFRIASAASAMVAALVGTWGQGLHPSPALYIVAGLVCALSSMGAAGVPGAAVSYTDAPAMLVLGAPIELIALYTAVIAIPDIFLTTANVTGDLTLATVVARLVRGKAAEVSEPAAEAA